MNKKFVENVKEFFRSVLVSIASLLIDTSALISFKRFVFNNGTKRDLLCATATGFTSGVVMSYCLSVMFVFKRQQKKEKTKRQKIRDFILFIIISITGFGLTELGMYTGVYILSFHYILTKAIVASLVHIWNHCLRKLLIFK